MQPTDFSVQLSEKCLCPVNKWVEGGLAKEALEYPMAVACTQRWAKPMQIQLLQVKNTAVVGAVCHGPGPLKI